MAAFACGFDEGDRIFFGGMSEHFKVPLNPFDGSGIYPEDRIYHEEKAISSTCSPAQLSISSGPTKDGTRFFAYVPFTARHDPRDTHLEFHAMYDASSLNLSPNCYANPPFDNCELEIRDEMLALFPRSPEVVREHLVVYYAMISHIDHQVGDLARSARRDRTA